ncbi:MAG: acylphosphatase [Syntrophobacteraceae bacterium]
MEKRRAHVWISGRVHGVFFRAFTRDTALQSGVRGWVRNLSDGRVEAVFEGETDAVEKMVQWCGQGSPMSRVDSVEVRDEDYAGDLDSFRIVY